MRPRRVSGAEVEIRIGHLWTVRNGNAVRLDVFAAREDARKADERAASGKVAPLPRLEV